MRRLPIAIQVHFVGKPRSSTLVPAIDDYAERISRLCRFSLIAHPSASTPALEARRIQPALGDSPFFALDPAGERLDSRSFLALVRSTTGRRDRSCRFVLGGASGLAEAVTGMAERLIALSPLTLSHDLARLLLLEQLYRSLATMAGSPYAK